MLMSISHNNVLSEFPFYNLDNQEFLRITGGWVHHSYHTLTESKDFFKILLLVPKKKKKVSCEKVHTTAIFNQNIIPSNKLEISFIRRISTMASL